MRAQQNFRYVINKIPDKPEIFAFMQEHGGVDDREAYGNLNMGAGYAFFVPKKNVETIMSLCNKLGYGALVAGHVEKSDSRKVIIDPLGLEYDAGELKVR